MRTPTISIVLILCSLLIHPIPGRSQQVPLDPFLQTEEAFARAYLSTDLRAADSLLEVLGQLQHASPSDTRRWYMYHSARRARLNLCLEGCPGLDEPEAELEALVAATEARRKQHPEAAAVQALLGSLQGLQIALSPMKGMFLGGKSTANLEKALAQDPDNPYVWMERAHAYYHTPANWGGDMEEAVYHYEQAISHFEQDSLNYAHGWQYPEALAWLGQAYQQLGQAEKARDAFQKALELAPHYVWVKEELLPSLSSR